MEEKGITVTEESNLPRILQTDDVLTAVIQAEARIKAFVKIKQLSLQATTALDWVNIGDTPYLQDTGTEKVAALFSPTVSKPTITKEPFPGGHYMYTCDGEAYWGGKSIPVMGSRTSRDQFFIVNKKDAAGKYVYIEGKRVPLEGEELLMKINPGDVRKSALTNYRNNAIKDVLGLEGVTWEDLAAAGIKKEDVHGYTFKGSKKPSENGSNKSTPPADEYADFRDKLIKAVSTSQLNYQWSQAKKCATLKEDQTLDLRGVYEDRKRELAEAGK